MKLKQLFTDESAVSPVIGVILMVAITVILAAVIGTFVLNLGGSVSQTTPQASFGFDFEDGETNDAITITHETGTTLSADQLTLKADADVDIYLPGGTAETGTNMTRSEAFTDSGAFSSGASVSAGDTLIAEGGDLKGAAFRVVWNSETGESSATISEYTAPSN